MLEGGDKQLQRELGTRRQVPFLLLAGSVLLGIVFGDAAHDIAQWITCAFSSSKCSDDSKITASALATLVVTFLAVYTASFATQSDDSNRTEADLAIIGAFAGALIALLKAAERDAGYPELHLLGRPLIVYVVALAAVFIPMTLRYRNLLTLQEERMLSSTIAIVVVVSAIVGGVWQIILTEIWVVGQDNGSARKFVVAPMAPIIATSVSAVLLVNHWKKSHIRVSMAIGWLFLATLAAAAFFFWTYLPQNGEPDGWITRANTTETKVGFYYLLLLLSGVIMITTLVVLPGKHWRLLQGIGIFVIFSLISAYSGFELGQARQSTGALHEGQSCLLALIHGLGPSVGLLSCYGGVKAQQLIIDRWSVAMPS